MALISRAFESTSSPFTFAFPFPALFLLAGFLLRSLARSFFTAAEYTRLPAIVIGGSMRPNMIWCTSGC